MTVKQDVLDIRGKVCPLPVIDVYRHLKEIAPGDTVCVLTSDPSSERNFKAFCRQSGHEIIEAKPQEKGVAIYIRKKMKKHH